MRSISLTIDDKKIVVPEGTTVFQAALGAGIYIPNLCFDPMLEPYGACRLCIVQIDGKEGFPISCTMVTEEGMVVRTDTESVNQIRRTIVKLLIADHPADCLSCTSNQRCELQKVAAYLGIKEQRLRRTARSISIDDSNPFFRRDLSKCILCAKCVRACQEIRGVSAIEVAGRGYESRVATFADLPISESVCESCGECVDRCPVGALAAKSELLPPVKEVKTICPYCGCGCGLLLGVRGNKIVQVRGDENNPINCGSLCVKGRFGLDFISSSDRLHYPLVKKKGHFERVSWEEALNLIVSRFQVIKEKNGADSLAGLSSAKCTNEENYLFQKFMRAVIGTNNVDHCARLCHASTVAGLARAFGSGAMTNSINELEYADCLFVTGSNTTEAHPIIGLKIKAAVTRHGAKLIVADPRKIDLVRFATLYLRQRPGTDVALFNGMINVIITEDLYDKSFLQDRTEGFEEFRKVIGEYTPAVVEKITGVPADMIVSAARLYANAQRSSIIYSMGITQHTTGTDNVMALANLALLTGQVGREATGVNPLRGQNNVQGACDLGALPNVFPGYQPVTDESVRRKFESAWGVHLPAVPGLTVIEMVHAIEKGEIQGLYVMGENPALSDPNSNRTRKALASVPFLVVQDIFLSETAQYADVVLPAASFAEKEGTFTNTERRIQRIRAAVNPPGESRPDWQVLCELAGHLGYRMDYENPGEIMEEIASLTPIYGGVTYERLEGAGLQWPCSDCSHPGTVFLHKGEFKRGKGKFHSTPFRDAAELPDDQYPFILSTGRFLYHFHTGTLSRRSSGLEEICPVATLEINPNDARKEKIVTGDLVEVTSRRGTVTARAVVTDRSPVGTVFMAFHFWEAAANILTNDALDPIAKIPELKVCAVRIKKINR